jgi:hypothetical protein
MIFEEVLSAHLEEPELSRIVSRECDMDISNALDIFKDTFLKCHETLVSFFKHAQERQFLRKDIEIHIISAVLLGGVLHVAQKDKINEFFFGNSIKNQKYRDSVVQHAMALCLQGCCNTQSSSSERDLPRGGI